MNYRLVFSFVFVLFAGYSSAQESAKDSASAVPEFIFKPTVGLGVGLLSYYGDIYDKHFQSPSVSRIAYELTVSQEMSDNVRFNFYFLRGKLNGNERFASDRRNLNFQSQITTGGINLQYDFGNFLKPDRGASPYISLGIEAFEFLSKTDLYDKDHNRYYYWNDGSIRNLPETDPKASKAVLLQRDYTYESDIRESNVDGFGKYPENSFAIPVGAGFTIKLNDYLRFQMGATMHFTFTDYIDGVKNNSTGNRAGNSKKDNFMMTSISLHYNFGLKDRDGNDELEDADIASIDNADEDGDGVKDMKDNCPGTPAGVPVDALGCPFDKDGDGVPDYKDDEQDSKPGAFVDEKGVTMSDSLIAYKARLFNDTAGAYLPVVAHFHNGSSAYNNLYQREYMVDLGTFSKGLPPELMTKFLSLSDIASNPMNDTTTKYTAGKYSDMLEAEKRKQELEKLGFTNVKVIMKEKGVFKDAPVFASNVPVSAKQTVSSNETSANETTENKTSAKENFNKEKESSANEKETKENSTATNKSSAKEKESKENNSVTKSSAKETREKTSPSSSNKSETSTPSGIVLRVQLGAFHKRLPKSVFNDISDLIEIKTEDGLYKYVTGSFKTFEAAAKHKVELISRGYEGAFIVAYKNGNRVSLTESGATPSKKGDLIDVPEPTSNDKKQISFKVQLGKFTNDVPQDKLELFLKIKGVKPVTDSDGSTRYLAGSFGSYAEAQKFKNEIIKTYGLKDAFIAAFNGNESIPVKEAIEMAK